LSSRYSRCLDLLRTVGIAPAFVAVVVIAAGASRAAEIRTTPLPAAPIEDLDLESQGSRAPEDRVMPPTEQLEPTEALEQPADPLSIVRRVDNPDMQIAITFDACATKTHGYGFDRPVYEILQREHVPTTIFVSGRWVEFHPEAMAELAVDPLIEFANHSYDHPHLTKLSRASIGDELDRTEAALGRHGARSVAFRPPFGDFSDRVLRVARERALPAVLWDVVSGDPSRATTAAGMIRTVVRDTRSGSIVIFHINGRGAQTASALPSILHQLRDQGFQFVHVSTLLAARVVPRMATSPGDPSTTRPPVRRSRSISVAAR
jgi:peptidoglycan-N-acetylglucosamine deacetylase